MRSSSAILAFAVLAASPALSSPLRAFDVVARAVPGAGTQDAVIGKAMQVLHKSTPSTPPQAREIFGALQRELTDEELQLVARGIDGLLALQDVGHGTSAARGLGLSSKSKEFLKLAAIVTGAVTIVGGFAAEAIGLSIAQVKSAAAGNTCAC